MKIENQNAPQQPMPEGFSNRKRLLIVSGFIGLIFLIIFIRLFYITLLSRPEDIRRRRPLPVTRLRGIIFDRNLFRMAISVQKYSIAIRPQKIKGNINTFQKDFLKPLSRITLKSEEEILSIIEKYFKAKLVYLKRKITLTYNQRKLLNTMPGVILLKEYERMYPYKSVASHIIGITGRNDKGLEGIEFKFDNILRQKYNIIGDNIVLSIDRDIQKSVERDIAITVMREQAESASVVIMNAKNGNIVAMANYPNYDLNKFRNLSRKEYNLVSKNLAVQSSDEIGSAFKAFIIAILAELDLVDLKKEYDCKGFYQVEGGKLIRDVAVYGKIKFPRVVKVSSNVGMIEAAMTIPKKTYYNYLKLLGFMEKTGIDLPYENSKLFRKYELFRNQARASVAIGQEIGVTPIQVATAACALVNGGYLLKPRIVIAIRKPGGDVSKPGSEIRNPGSSVKKIDTIVKRKIFSKKSNDMVWYLLSQVMASGGTGYRANITVNGRKLNIVGKTGTAQVYDKKRGRYSQVLRNTSFLGFIKRPRNTYVVFVIVRKPMRAPDKSTGSTIAVPLFRRIISNILDTHGSRFP